MWAHCISPAFSVVAGDDSREHGDRVTPPTVWLEWENARTRAGSHNPLQWQHSMVLGSPGPTLKGTTTSQQYLQQRGLWEIYEI